MPAAEVDPVEELDLHTMLRITDLAKTRTSYEALGLEFRRETDIVRNGEREATNYFYGVPGEFAELEFTLNRDGRTYELGTAYGHVDVSAGGSGLQAH